MNNLIDIELPIELFMKILSERNAVVIKGDQAIPISDYVPTHIKS